MDVNTTVHGGFAAASCILATKTDYRPTVVFRKGPTERDSPAITGGAGRADDES